MKIMDLLLKILNFFFSALYSPNFPTFSEKDSCLIVFSSLRPWGLYSSSSEDVSCYFPSLFITAVCGYHSLWWYIMHWVSVHDYLVPHCGKGLYFGSSCGPHAWTHDSLLASKTLSRSMLGCFHGKVLKVRVYLASFSSSTLLLLSRFSRVWICATPKMAAHQTAPSLVFSRQEHWSGLPFPSPMHESERWKWSRSVVSNS